MHPRRYWVKSFNTLVQTACKKIIYLKKRKVNKKNKKYFYLCFIFLKIITISNIIAILRCLLNIVLPELL